MRRSLFAFLLSVLLAPGGDLRAGGSITVPTNVQLAIFEKVWTLDRSFPSRGTVVLLVVYQRRNRESFQVKEDMIAAASLARGVSVRSCG